MTNCQQMVTDIDELLLEMQRERTERGEKRNTRSRWTLREETAFEQLVVRFGGDFSLLGNLLPSKTQKQIRKRYRYLLTHKAHRIQRMEEEMRKTHRKDYFDRHLAEENELSETGGSQSSSDLSLQSLQ